MKVEDPPCPVITNSGQELNIPTEPGEHSNIGDQEPLQGSVQPPLSLARVADSFAPAANRPLQTTSPSPLSIARVADSLDPAAHTPSHQVIQLPNQVLPEVTMADGGNKDRDGQQVQVEIQQQLAHVDGSRRKLNRLLDSFTARNVSAATLGVAEARLKEIRELHLDIWDSLYNLRVDYVNELTKEKH